MSTQEITEQDLKAIDIAALKYAHQFDRDKQDLAIEDFNEGAEWGILHERAAARWKSIAKYGLPGEAQYGKWIELLKFLPHSSVGPIIFFRQWYEGIDAPAIETLRRIYTHWRELELPTQS